LCSFFDCEEEDYRDPVQDLEDLRSFAEQKSAQANVKPIVKKARRLLYRRLKVGVADGRVFVGNFHCLDKQGNIILYDTVEFRNVPGSGDEGVALGEQRGLGLVLVPARCRTSCHVECSLEEKMDLLNLCS
jgi:small nuclear ribonucleoprotein (snRNP)-like protein